MNSGLIEQISYAIQRIGLGEELTDVVLADCLAKMGQSLGANRIACFLKRDHWEGCFAEWNDGSSLPWQELNFSPENLRETTRRQLAAGQAVWLMVGDLPESLFKSNMRERGTESLLFAPLIYRGKLKGMLLAEQFWESRVWSPEECWALKCVADVTASALQGESSLTDLGNYQSELISEKHLNQIAFFQDANKFLSEYLSIIEERVAPECVAFFRQGEASIQAEKIVGTLPTNVLQLTPNHFSHLIEKHLTEEKQLTIFATEDFFPKSGMPDHFAVLPFHFGNFSSVFVVFGGQFFLENHQNIWQQLINFQARVALHFVMISEGNHKKAQMNFAESSLIDHMADNPAGKQLIGIFRIDYQNRRIDLNRTLVQFFGSDFDLNLNSFLDFAEGTPTENNPIPFASMNALELAEYIKGAEHTEDHWVDSELSIIDGVERERHFMASMEIRSRNSDGSVKMAVGILYDVSKQQSLSTQLNKAQDNLKNAMILGRMGFWEYDFSKRVFYWSDEAKALLGTSENVCSFEEGIDILGASDRERIASAYFKAAAGIQDFDVYFEVGQGGQCRHIHSRALVESDGTEAQKLYGFMQDVSATKSAELALEQRSEVMEEQRETLESFIARLNLGVLGVNKGRDSEYVICNPAVTKILGYSRSEILGNLFDDLFSGEHFGIEIIEESGDSALQNEDYGQVEYTTPHGEHRSLHLRKFPSLSPSGALSGTFLLIEDVTERQRNQEDTKRAQKLEILSRLSSSIGLEFNNMLHVIDGYGELILKDLNTKTDAHENMTLLLGASQRAKSQVGRLLSISQESDLHKTELDLIAFLQRHWSNIQDAFGHSVTLQQKNWRDVLYINADESRIQAMVYNLGEELRKILEGRCTLEVSVQEWMSQGEISTARHFEKHYASINLVIRQSGRFTQQLEQLLEAGLEFNDVESLGMAEVYAIAKKHGGDLKLKRNIRDNTTELSILLPLSDRHTATASPYGVDEDDPAGVETILLAEDEALVRRLAVHTLEKAGYRVLVANNGEEALSAYQSNAGIIDILVFDVVMPEMNGREAYDRIAAVDPNIPVIFCSGYNDEQLQAEYLFEIGGGFLQKPFRPRQLLQKIREMLDRKSTGARV